MSDAADRDLTTWAEQQGVKYFLFNFTDLFGNQRAKLVPARAARGMQRSGAGFAGFASWLDFTPAHPDMQVKPDPASVIQLPWKPEVAWVAGDCWMGGELVEQGPRNVLKRLMARAADKGMVMKAGVEPEFQLINADGSDIADSRDTQAKPCYDQSAIMRSFDVIGEICDTILGLGWEPYQNDHEDASGQFEINWNFADALTTADQLCFFKFLVKSIAEKHGLRATFMPKPFAHLTGNGCHVHVSMWDTDGKRNRFDDESDELGLSREGYHFVGGLIEHAEALTAIVTPTINSYKRLNPAPTRSGAAWSPSSITYGGDNRTTMIRIPDKGRIEFRLPDNAANPYLLMASILAAGLDGQERSLDPGERVDIDMYSEGHKLENVGRLPLNLLDALRRFEEDEVLGEALGSGFSASYRKLRRDDWNNYCRHLSVHERETTLDC